MAHILLVDDSEDLLEMVALGLSNEGYEVTTASDGEQALERLAEGSFDLLISDVNMPRLDGFGLCMQIREKDTTLPIILLTSRDTEIDEALGLDLGADDYVTKPVSNRVLAARTRALLRRGQARASVEVAVALEHGPITIDVERMEVVVDGSELELTVTEFRLLHFFVEQPGKVLNRDRLLRAMRDDESFVSDRMVDSYVNRLRRKIESAAPGFDGLETVVGMGYRLRDL